MGYLIVERPNARPEKINLDGPTTIGRSRDAGIWVSDLRLSREHCRVEKRKDGWYIVDLKSSNGTRIDGQRIVEQKLNDGLKVEVGDTKLTFKDGTYVNRRPADPIEARKRATQSNSDSAIFRSGGSTLMGTKFATKVMPDESVEAESDAPKTPLAFTRPPATPIVAGIQERKSEEGSGWFKSLVGRLLG